ncbi:prostaglandin E synthase [Leptinotarsa decemlineata]|uniref:prostaglandin E synthase n=1 Tax=Leptinotarsa decemlineata TaxID=7539 RepID=UPI000C253BA9|nr:prostaglandin E synthase-like [Leptinotarsa decemlineata]
MSANVGDFQIFVNVYSLANPAFCSYLLCVSLLVLKMMGTILLIVYHRMTTKSFISEEDAVWQRGDTAPNEKVERVRRALMNDLENIIMFLFMSLAYLSVRPPLWVVNLLLAIFLVSRVLHTFFYAMFVVRQPVRAILWTIGFIITGYMAAHTALYLLINGYIF